MEAMKRNLAVLLCAAAIGLTSTAQAQNPELGDTGEGAPAWAPPAAGGSASASASASTETGVQTSGDTSGDSSSPSASPSGSGAHADAVGSIGVGFFGVQDIPICLEGGTCAGGNVSAPSLGVRYWLSEMIGIEGAIGIGSESGTISRTGMPDELETSLFGFALHGGVPLALAYSGDFVFQVVPELNVAFASGTDYGPTPDADVDLSGFMFQLGGRVGAEVHFGFIGLPQLSLQATVGLHLTLESRTLEGPGGGMGRAEVSNSRTIIRTTIQNEPWDIFTGNITAIYYFYL